MWLTCKKIPFQFYNSCSVQRQSAMAPGGIRVHHNMETSETWIKIMMLTIRKWHIFKTTARQKRGIEEKEKFLLKWQAQRKQKKAVRKLDLWMFFLKQFDVFGGKENVLRGSKTRKRWIWDHSFFSVASLLSQSGQQTYSGSQSYRLKFFCIFSEYSVFSY